MHQRGTDGFQRHQRHTTLQTTSTFRYETGASRGPLRPQISKTLIISVIRHAQKVPCAAYQSSCFLETLAPAGSVEDDSHKATRDNPSDRERNDPSHVDPCHHSPVDSAPCSIA